MKRPLLALSVACLAAACAPGDTSGLEKDVAGLKTDLQKTQDDAKKLAVRVEQQDRRITGLQDDLAAARQMSLGVREAAAPSSGGVAATDGADAAPPEATSKAFPPADAAAIGSYLSTEEGKKILEAAIQADRDARSKEQAKRQVEGAVDRFAKIANLTEDQTKRMKELMAKQAETLRDIFATARELPPTASQQQRDEVRTANVAKADEVRKQTDEALKSLFSQQQYETYENEAERMRAGLRGFAGGGSGVQTGGRKNNRGGQGGQTAPGK